ncbi:sucrase ferredoxin [Corynebacterium aquatimens]|uniref:sucrase ferredoxin n=1 Tax=Corynebacterium aquatimens TaxID=1190508 RepID=UPI0033132E67
MTNNLRCSDVDVEPLPGTAKTGGTYVLFEWPGPWGRDVLDGDTLGAELSAKLSELMKRYGATLLLVRHPTREGRQIKDHHVYLVFAEEGVTEVLHVDGPEELLGLDLSGPGKNGASVRTRPLLLVCTHGKRDMCCAVKGRPLVTELVGRSRSGGTWCGRRPTLRGTASRRR